MAINYLYYYDTEMHDFLSSDTGSFRHKGGKFKDLSFVDKVAGISETLIDLSVYGSLTSVILNYLGHQHRDQRSISLFLEPLPTNIATMFGGKHNFYTPGKRLYEYRVELSTWVQRLLDLGQFPYRITGTPEVRDLIFKNGKDWGSPGDAKDVYKYQKEITDLEKRMGYFGRWGIGITKALNNAGSEGIDKSIKKSIELMTAQGRETELYKDKAPWIPQLVIFPGVKPVAYDDYKEIVLR